MNECLHAATASVRSLSSSGVHGTNLGGAIVCRGEERDNGEVGRKGEAKGGINYDTGEL